MAAIRVKKSEKAGNALELPLVLQSDPPIDAHILFSGVVCGCLSGIRPIKD